MACQKHASKCLESKMIKLNMNDDKAKCNTNADKAKCNDLGDSPILEGKACDLSDEDILDDFLTLKARMLISSLENKKANLEAALQNQSCDIKKMRERLDCAEKYEKNLHKEVNVMKRNASKKECILKKKMCELENKEQELCKKSAICQELQKEVECLKKDLREEKKTSSMLSSQNKGLKLQIEKRCKIIEVERENFQNIRDRLQNNIKEHDETNKQLKKQSSDLVLVVKEQQKLIEVLRQQKAVILGASVSKAMEEEFKEIIENICDKKK